MHKTYSVLGCDAQKGIVEEMNPGNKVVCFGDFFSVCPLGAKPIVELLSRSANKSLSKSLRVLNVMPMLVPSLLTNMMLLAQICVLWSAHEVHCPATVVLVTSACTSCSQVPSNACVRTMMVALPKPATTGSVRLLVEVHLRNLLEGHAHIRHCDIKQIIECHHSCLTDRRDEVHFYFPNFFHLTLLMRLLDPRNCAGIRLARVLPRVRQGSSKPVGCPPGS